MATKKAAATVVEDEDEVELEEVEEADDEDAPAPKDEVWGVRQLIALAKEKFGIEYKPREVRTLLRKMAREGGGIDREIIAGNKQRYSWTGPEDPEVKAVLKQIKAGAIETAKKAALDKLKADKAKKTAAAPAKKGTSKKAAPPADDDDEEDDD